MSSDPYSTHPLQVSPEVHRRTGPGWAAFSIVLALLLLAIGAGVWLLLSRIDAIDAALKTTNQSVNTLAQGLDSSRAELSGVKESLSTTQTQLNDLGLDVTELDQGLQTQEGLTIDVAALTKRVMPSVVTVSCGNAGGTGFAIESTDAPSGFPTTILTNHHVVADCTDDPDSEVVVRQSGASTAARLARWDVDSDLALLYAAEEIPFLAVGETPEVGEPVIAVGSPYGVDGTVTSGTITNVQDGYVTHSAALAPGNSGGPLVDRDGKVVGVNSAKVEDSEGQNIAVRMRVACQNLISCP